MRIYKTKIKICFLVFVPQTSLMISDMLLSSFDSKVKVERTNTVCYKQRRTSKTVSCGNERFHVRFKITTQTNKNQIIRKLETLNNEIAKMREETQNDHANPIKINLKRFTI